MHGPGKPHEYLLGPGLEVVITGDIYFVRSNPNEHHRPDSGGALPASKERNRFKGIVWDEYDPVHQKYLEIGRSSLLSSSE